MGLPSALRLKDSSLLANQEPPDQAAMPPPFSSGASSAAGMEETRYWASAREDRAPSRELKTRTGWRRREIRR